MIDINIDLTTQVPRIIEGTDPGLREFTAADFAEPPTENDEQKIQRATLLNEIKVEQYRLGIDNSALEFLIHQQTGAMSLTEGIPVFNVMLFRDYLRGLESRQLPEVEIEAPPYLDFQDGILYIGGNNKELMKSWVYFLTESHTFAVVGNWNVAIEQRFLKPVKYQATIKGVASVEALKWIQRFFNPKKHPPLHPIVEWKRSPPEAPKPAEPVWVVRVDMKEVFKGCEVDARKTAIEHARKPQSRSVGIISPDYKCEYLK